MDNSYVLSTFNDQFTEFIEDVERAFPNNLDITTCKNALIGIRKANPKLIIRSEERQSSMIQMVSTSP